MTDLPPATGLVRAPKRGPQLPYGAVRLGHEDRFLRRRRLMTVGGEGFLVDLAETVSLEEGDCFRLSDGRLIEVVSEEEPVLVVTGDLARLAWHIGNRHTPCQIEADRLVIREDHVLEAMLRQLGATVTHAREPFRPEGGAYGHGRTMGHEHGHSHHGTVHFHGSHRHDDDATPPDEAE